MSRLSKALPPEDRLVLLPKNPGEFFSFWNFSGARQEAFRSGALGAEVEVRLFCIEGGTAASSKRAAWDSGGAYVAIPEHGRSYVAALYAQRGGEWEKLLESNVSAAPAAAGSEQDRAYASLEFYRRGQ